MEKGLAGAICRLGCFCSQWRFQGPLLKAVSLDTTKQHFEVFCLDNLSLLSSIFLSFHMSVSV